jgi:hypothetical protein
MSRLRPNARPSPCFKRLDNIDDGAVLFLDEADVFLAQHVFKKLENLRAAVGDKCSARSAASTTPPEFLAGCRVNPLLSVLTLAHGHGGNGFKRRERAAVLAGEM